ncbi:MAG TPA: ABC transporter substrate-binding protein, partial [Anaeromyxobacteraceae bacterium]|nr:ABC transporter substrate-binding protein [Anaeromyxobacteraceae bacterium]
FNDPAVRKAMRLAFDREKAIQVAYLGFGHPGNDLFGEAHASYNSSLPQRTYDPAAAKNLLQAAGYTLPLKVTLYCADGGAGMIEGAEVLQQSAKAAGFDVTLKKVTPGELYNPATVLGKVPLGMDFYGGNSFQQMVFQTMLSNAPTPEFGMNSKAFDKAFYSALAILDPAKRKAAYDAIQKQLWEDGGAIVWAYADNITAFSSKVGGTEAFDGPTIGLFYPGLNSGDLWIQH